MGSLATFAEASISTRLDLADALLIVAAERLGVQRIFTLDSDFHIYRLLDGSALETVP